MEIETFIPFNQNHGIITVEYIGMEKSRKEGFSDILVVEHEGRQTELHWDDYECYYKGFIWKNNKPIEGYVV